MQTYLTLITFLSLVGFYAAAVVLASAVPTFVLGIEDGAAIRRTLAIGLGAVTATLALWRVHWASLRQLWTERPEAGNRYLFCVSSLSVVATAVSAGRLVAGTATLLLGTMPASDAGWADLLSALFLFVISWLIWRHHWGLLQEDGAASPAGARARRLTHQTISRSERSSRSSLQLSPQAETTKS